MSLLTTVYVCGSCGNKHDHRHKPEAKPLRVWQLHCTKCRRKRIFRPRYKPVTGDYR